MSATAPPVNGNGPSEVIEGSAVEVYQAPSPSGLFGTDDPVEIVARASKVAAALKSVIVAQRLYKNINGSDHVLVEGWTTLGSMLGVVPIVTWSRRIEPPTKYDVEVIHYEWVNGSRREKGRSNYQVEGYDWEARVEARTMDGRTVGGAEAMCSRKELTWSKRDDYALRSMAQTRATSKALRGPLGFIVSLAGYAATPAEEMPAETGPPTPSPAPAPEPVAALPDVVVKQLVAAIKATGRSHEWVRMQLVALGAGDVPEGPVRRSTLAQLSEADADQLIAICDTVTRTSRVSEDA
jgi:hypothetical protein